MQTKGITVQFEGEHKKLIPTWKQVKKCFQKGSKEKRLEQYRKKEM